MTVIVKFASFFFTIIFTPDAKYCKSFRILTCCLDANFCTKFKVCVKISQPPCNLFLACEDGWEEYTLGGVEYCFKNLGRHMPDQIKSTCDNVGAKVPLPQSQGYWRSQDRGSVFLNSEMAWIIICYSKFYGSCVSITCWNWTREFGVQGYNNGNGTPPL